MQSLPMLGQGLANKVPNLTERQSNTPEQISDYLGQALRAMEVYDIPADLRQVAFGKLLDWSAAKHVISEPTLAERSLFNNG